jgi:hypothetical protein
MRLAAAAIPRSEPAEVKLPGRPFEDLPGIGDFMIGAEPAAAAGLPIS